MSEFHDLDDLFAALNSDATSAELGAERATVDLMATTHRPVKGNHMFTSRRSRVATFVAAGVLGFGGVAAAGPGNPFDSSEPPVTTTDTEHDREDEFEEQEIEEEVEEEAEHEDEVEKQEIVEEQTFVLAEVEEEEEEKVVDDDLAAQIAALEEYCNGEDVELKNHGEIVSQVARGEFDEVEGIGVVAAAHSNCGKKDHDAGEPEPESEEQEIDEKVEEKSSELDDGDRAGKGSQNSNRGGNKHGNSPGGNRGGNKHGRHGG